MQFDSTYVQFQITKGVIWLFEPLQLFVETTFHLRNFDVMQ